MSELVINIKLLSDTIFGSGQSLPGFVDLEVLHDEFGIPYLKGKTLKGKLKEEMINITNLLKGNTRYNLNDIIDELFGKEGYKDISVLRFSNLELDKDVASYLKYGVQNNIFTSEELLNSLTNVRSSTAIDKSGVAKDKSLRQYRVINRGLDFKSYVYLSRELSEYELGFLASGISALRHIGAVESRGLGNIKATLLKRGNDITNESIKKFGGIVFK